MRGRRIIINNNDKSWRKRLDTYYDDCHYCLFSARFRVTGVFTVLGIHTLTDER